MTPDRFDELIERYADGTLGPAERDEFLRLLQDPAQRARFAEFCAFEAVMGEERAEQAARRPTPRRLAAVRPAPSTGSSFWIAAGVAAAFILALLLLSGGGDGRAPAGPAAKVATPEPLRVPREERPPGAVPKAPPPVEAAKPLRPFDPPKVVPAPNLPAPSRKEDPKVVPPPAPVVPPTQSQPVIEEKETIAQVSRLDRVQGTVSVIDEAGESAAVAGAMLRAGQGVRTGGGESEASLVYADGTRITLTPETTLRRIQDRPGKSGQLERGLVWVEAVRQAAGKPLSLAGPHAEASVLGTQFSLSATPSYTRLDVTEGRVKFTRAGGVTSVVVNAGHFAMAGPGLDFAARASPAIWKAPAQGLYLWLKADAGVKPSTGAVASWLDQSPVGNHASQAAAGSRPTLVSGAVGVRPALRFDGIDDSLALPAGFADFRAGLTAFVVARVSTGTAWVRFLDLGAGPQCDNIFFGRKETADKLAFWVYANDVTKGKVEAPGAILSDAPQTLSVVMNPQGRVTLYRNGMSMGTGQTSVPVSVVRKPNHVAKSNYNAGDPPFKGDLAEVLLFGRALPEAERAYVEAYLQAKYFDPTAPPPLTRPADR